MPIGRERHVHAWMAFAAVCVMTAVWNGIVGNTISLFAEPMIKEHGITRAQFMISCATLVCGIPNSLRHSY